MYLQKCVLTKILADQKSFDIMFKSVILCKLYSAFFFMLHAILQLFLKSYILVVSVTKTYEHAILPFRKIYAFSNQSFGFILFKYTSWFQINA